MPVKPSRTIQEKPSLSQTDINYGFGFRTYFDGANEIRYIMSDAVNRHIRADKIVASDRGKVYAIPEEFKAYSEKMLEHQLGQVEPGQFENHRIVGIYGDLTPSCDEVPIGQAEYYDFLATFYSFPFVYVNEGGNIAFRGASYIMNDFGVIYPLSSCKGANPLGASTIAVTSDNKMLVALQPEDAYVNAGKLMPSGSGVVSWHDYIDSGAETIQDIVSHCAEWKLRDESGIPGDIRLDTEVLGMARVPLGMKPDFFCFTKIDASWDELQDAGAKPFDIVAADDSTHLSDALLAYIAEKNSEKAGSVSIQLRLCAELLADICR